MYSGLRGTRIGFCDSSTVFVFLRVSVADADLEPMRGGGGPVFFLLALLPSTIIIFFYPKYILLNFIDSNNGWQCAYE